ncbi:MAG: hypothetical protein SWX82_01690 [Cyanobacteriota bacterium]|nr:hypothetical protein [Cyanobacteriota bacterium]
MAHTDYGTDTQGSGGVGSFQLSVISYQLSVISTSAIKKLDIRNSLFFYPFKKGGFRPQFSVKYVKAQKIIF